MFLADYCYNQFFEYANGAKSREGGVIELIAGRRILEERVKGVLKWIGEEEDGNKSRLRNAVIADATGAMALCVCCAVRIPR